MNYYNNMEVFYIKSAFSVATIVILRIRKIEPPEARDLCVDK